MIFRDKDELIRIQLEIEGVVICEKEIYPSRYEITKQHLKRKALREFRNKEWAIFVIRRRTRNTAKHLRTSNYKTVKI